MKRIPSAVLAMTLLLSCGATALAQGGSAYFADVATDAWYAPYIDVCHGAGLMQGVGDGRFDPDGTLSCAEMMTVCARLHSVLGGGSGTLPVMPAEEKTDEYMGAWYDDTMYYWENALPNIALDDDFLVFEAHITAEYTQVNFTSYAGAEADCPRGVLACMLAMTLAGEDLPILRSATAIPDCDYPPVHRLYSGGILGGVDDAGTFNGHGSLTRAELATVVARVVEPELRLGHMPSSFDFDLLARMPRDENYMVSPISLKIALAMAANGASGVSRQEILDVLGIADLEQYNEDMAALIAAYNGNETVVLNVANSIWYNIGYDQTNGIPSGADDGRFSKDFTAIIQGHYDGLAQTITNANGAKRVNDWISEQTNDKIKNMVSDDMVKDSLSFLVNAIYFKGGWQRPFRVESTRDHVFTSRDETIATIPFMNDTAFYDYYESDTLRMLAKPYQDSNIRMYFLLPKGDAPLTQTQFDEGVTSMSSEEVFLSVPKFKTEYLHKNLVELLKGFGIRAAFDPDTADFWNMYEDIPAEYPPYISDVLQKTFIEVDEKGTEATAVTIIEMATATSMAEPAPIIEFICDRPFTYIIRDDNTGTILFVGEYAFGG